MKETPLEQFEIRYIRKGQGERIKKMRGTNIEGWIYNMIKRIEREGKEIIEGGRMIRTTTIGWIIITIISIGIIIEKRERIGRMIRGYRTGKILGTIMVIIGTCNIIGLIPKSYTITSQGIIGLITGGGVFIGYNIKGIKEKGRKIIGHMIPTTEVSGWLIPLIVIIETISYIFRVISISIRLFANIMAGHTILKIIISQKTIPIIIIMIIVWGLIILEGGVALIQAYIYCTMLDIYYKDIVNEK